MDTRTIFATAMALAIGAPVCAHAQGVATDKLIDAITVTGLRERAAVEVPNPTASKTADELRTQNLFNPEDALNYLPNLTIRKRYIGDRNALIGGRSFSTLQPARGLVFMDGYLLSNFLGRFDAPRWNMIAPEEIERVDVLYGPYSATYPGNSIGTTVAIRTRRPEGLETSVRTTAFSEHFDEYGIEDDYTGYQVPPSSAIVSTTDCGSRWRPIARMRPVIRCSTTPCLRTPEHSRPLQHRLRPSQACDSTRIHKVDDARFSGRTPALSITRFRIK